MEDGKVIFLFTFSLFASNIEVDGLCNFPCSRFNKTWEGYSSAGPQVPDHIFTDDLSKVWFGDGTFGRCWERLRQFYVVRKTIDGKNYYRCLYAIPYDFTNDVQVLFSTNLIQLDFNPTICDVCNGTGFPEQPEVFVVKDSGCKVVIPPKLPCNLPAICPVTNPETQIKCTGCEISEYQDDGLCC